MSRALLKAQRRLSVLANHVRGMSSQDVDDVQFSKCGIVGHARLNRPKALNALNLSMLSKLFAEFKRWEADDTVAAYVLSGNGGRAFCAGGDVRTLAQAAGAGDEAAIKEFFQTEFTVDHQLASLRKPVVALVDGVYMGGGVGIASQAPFRVATERTIFAMPETSIGFFPDVGVTHVLSRMGNLGRFIALTGMNLHGCDVLRAGLATHYVPSGSMDTLAKELEAISSADEIGSVLSRYHAESGADADDSSFLSRHGDEIESLFSGDSLPSIMNTLESLVSSSEFAKKMLSVLQTRCPQSLAVAWEQLRRNKDLSHHDVLVSDYRLALRVIVHSEFREGIRAALIDKDKWPKWSTSLDTIDVSPLFEPLPIDDWRPLS